ncbi:disease resistance protein At4g27190 isoform X2 [Hevea brasiliensis]|uniref:disease resistance protein At4g27190 isoform X2 n=1 Tax=Hevea brasiliensis TaxID=3981 RepID=UPI0025EBDF10|nr:disease resistance protein At4g27190 isoform X2 [Hevea brasiliensis]
MDFVASTLGTVLVETGRLLCGSISSDISSCIRFRSKCNNLEKEMQNLISLRDDLNQELETAFKDGKLPTSQVKEWLQQVEEVMLQMNLIHEGMIANNNSKRKFCGWFLNYRQRCRLGKKMVRALNDIERLNKATNFPRGMVAKNHPAPTVEHIPGPLIEDQTTATKTLAQLMELLNDDEVRRIGVWGMGGVGKTTLVKSLNNKLRAASMQPFSVVIWATVSRNFNLRRVQTQIAERLNMVVKSDESVEGLAIRLHQRLEKEKNFLVILDDVWEEIDLDHLGIPQLEVHTGSKIILTSRLLDVLRGMKTDRAIKVDKLNDEEAWELFSRNAGEVVCLEHIRPLAESIAKECSGLPLAIITMGKAMRGKKMVKLWKHALSKLQKSVPFVSGIEEKVYNILKWSYDTLEEGLIDEQQSYEDLVISGISLLENLKDSCLLEDGARKGTVKMHDVVRDVAKWIAWSLEDGCKSLVQSGKELSEISEAEFLNSLKRVSFMNNKIRTLPNCATQCSEASTLLLQGNPLEAVPERFLQGFQALRVLNLSGTRLLSLPLSLLQLNDLRVLLLKECYYLEELPSLDRLSKLQVLDLCATRIRELPRGIEQLSQLRQVNLSRTHCLKNIPAGTISRLSALEVLDMTLSDYHWDVREQLKEGEATFEELMNLQKLVVLSVRLKCIPSLGIEVPWIDRLRRFQFFIGEQANSLPTRHAKRRVTISGLNLSEEWIGGLLSNVKSLVLNHCWGLNQMLETLTIDSTSSFIGLKSLTISNSNSSLRPAGGCAAHYDMLPNLEELYLDRLTYLESISELVGHLGLRFSRLKIVEVARCPRLTDLLPYGSFILALPSLEEIKVSFCDKLEELFRYCSGHNSTPEPVVPSLRIMELKNLPKLRTLCREWESWPRLEHVDVVKCNLLRKPPLTIQNVNAVTLHLGE